ncbi:hypothetical protein [Streptomyces sp. NBC_00582]|uniref:hypothetical protein n=1 Tax=Streptomyces sp. NBC_00582 TaxID=2975783 RepID=UPI002E8017F4|nr:hypothetical protein [Streptomyces sp. NBC_00582]WUB64411.1 hypothetical protein OG852_30485 [Streptomyces sp. NBC_00582]
MSFSIHAAGLVADAVEQVKAAECQGDSSQFEALRALILAELTAWPSSEHGPKGVFVEASGHHDVHSRNLSLTIRPMYIKVPAESAR